MDPIATQLIRDKRIQDLFILARYMYKTQERIIDDSMYNKIEKTFIANGVLPEYTSRTYDDDPAPMNLLREFNLQHIIPLRNESRDKFRKLLESEKSTSIRSVTEYWEAWNMFNSVRGYDLVMSIKTDGLFTQKAYEKRDFVVGLSRGRTGECFDFTDALNMVVPRMVDLPGLPDIFRVYSECQVKASSLEYLRNKYDPNKYKMEKSGAMSMLSNMEGKDKEDYENHISLLTFRVDGIADTLSESLLLAEQMGFKTVPWVKIPAADVPETFEEFLDWVRPILDDLKELQDTEDIAADGVVVEVDDMSFVPDITGQYSSKNFALKLEHWSFAVYPAIVTGMESEQGAMFRSCKLTIEPFKTKDRATAKLINSYNLDILQENGIYPGSRIYFERNSGAINSLLHGGRLERIYAESTREEEVL